MKKLLKYLKGYEKECVLGPLFKLLEATFELLVPLVVASIVDKGIGSGDRGYIVKMCALMIGLGVVGLASSVTAQYFSAVAAVGFSTRLRHTVLEHILSDYHHYVERVRKNTLSSQGRAGKAAEEHKAILNAVREKNEELAEKLANEHIYRSLENIKKQGMENLMK